MKNVSMDLKLSSPWQTHYHKLQCLFGDDPDITLAMDEDTYTTMDEDTYTIRIFVTSTDKAEALTRLLCPEIQFGNVTMRVEVVPSNQEKSYADLVRDVFKGNPHFHQFVKVQLQSNPVYYAIFKKEVAQFYNDNLSDAHGNVSTLYEVLARDLIGQEGGVYFCTDNEDDDRPMEETVW